MAANNTHHGGAWKVAYADFVTAMMALFMVLWLTSQDEETLTQMAQYFQDPYNTPLDNSMGVMSNKGSSGLEASAGKAKGKAEISDIKTLYEMAQEFMRLLDVDSIDPDNRPYDIAVTGDGLRITLYDRIAHPFFVDKGSECTEWGKFVIETMAWLLERQNFKIRVDGHVAEGYRGDGMDYTAWELSTDRANATRRYLEHYRVNPGKFNSVTGFGSSQPLPEIEADSDSNDRVTISLVLSDKFNKFDDKE